MVIYIDGTYKKADSRLSRSLMPGVVPGEGVFETMRVRDGNILDQEAHLKRLRRGLRRLGIAKKISSAQLEQIKDKLLQKNRFKNARLRLSVWRYRRKTHVAVVVQTIARRPRGIRLGLSSVQRPLHRFTHLKSIRYEVFRQALDEARAKGYDEALLLNRHGHIVEASTANIFWVKGNTLLTPATVCGCLRGVTRDKVLQAARACGLRVKTGRFRLNSLKHADAAFLTNALVGILPVKSLERKPFKNSQVCVAIRRHASL